MRWLLLKAHSRQRLGDYADFQEQARVRYLHFQRRSMALPDFILLGLMIMLSDSNRWWQEQKAAFEQAQKEAAAQASGDPQSGLVRKAIHAWTKMCDESTGDTIWLQKPRVSEPCTDLCTYFLYFGAGSDTSSSKTLPRKKKNLNKIQPSSRCCPDTSSSCFSDSTDMQVFLLFCRQQNSTRQEEF